MHRYENLLLQYYQKYLQRLENVVVFLLKMKRTTTHEKVSKYRIYCGKNGIIFSRREFASGCTFDYLFQ